MTPMTEIENVNMTPPPCGGNLKCEFGPLFQPENANITPYNI